MRTILKILIILITLVYIISPIDGVPGPIDDVIVALIGIAGARKIGANES
jgi:uncharacterized membrane protein YkvA (DUF1232 family)